MAEADNVTREGHYYSEAERVTVEDRGLQFGKIYVHDANDYVEAIFVWSRHGISPEGIIEPTREQKNRAVRALAELPAGRKALGVEIPRPPAVAQTPSAEELRAWMHEHVMPLIMDEASDEQMENWLSLPPIVREWIQDYRR